MLVHWKRTTQSAFHMGPRWAPGGSSWAPVGLTWAHLGMLLGKGQGRRVKGRREGGRVSIGSGHVLLHQRKTVGQGWCGGR